MSEQNTPVASGVTSKKEKTTIDVYHASCLSYFRIETLELVFISESDAGEFDHQMNQLSMLMEKIHKAKADYSSSIEAYGKKQKDIANKNELAEYLSAVTKAESMLEILTAALQQEIGQFDEQAGYKPLVELIPLEPLRKGVYGRYYSYIKKTDYDAFVEGGKAQLIKLNVFGSDDIYIRDEKGNIISIDVKVISDKLKNAKAAIGSMLDKTKRSGMKVDYERTLTDWAQAWNEQKSHYQHTGRYIDVSAGAQFLRFSSNTAYQASWDPESGKGSFKGEATAELALFTGEVESSIYLPDRVGWQLKCIVNDENKEANLGVLRAQIEGGLSGFAGASAQIETNVQFVNCNGKQLLMGLRAPASRFKDRRDGIVVHDDGEAPKALEVKTEMFAGLKGGGGLGGAIQWLKPFDSLVSELPAMLKTFGVEIGHTFIESVINQQKQRAKKDAALGEFTNFASLTMGGEVQLGAGFSGDFQFRFEKGRFKFHMAAGVCLGPGAKGDLQGEITPQMFEEFAIWAVYQLYGMDFKHFKILAKDAFMALSYILVMGGKTMYVNYYEDIRSDIAKVSADFESFIKRASEDFSASKVESEERTNYAVIVNSKPELIYSFTPEAKGAALHLLTGDGAYDRIDYKNQGDGFLADTSYERKKAILIILSSIQTKREWRKVLARMTADGLPNPKASNSKAGEERVVQQQELILRKILKVGFDRDKELDALINKLELRDFQELYQRLKDHPAFGYPFSPNCTKQYALHCDDNPFYNSLCHFMPEDPTIKHRLEPFK